MFRSLRRFIWKAYKIYCFFIATLLSLYVIFTISHYLLQLD